MSDFLSRLVQRNLEQVPVMRPLILPWVNSTPMPAGETRHESIQEGSDEQITTLPVMPDLNSPSQQPAPSLISTATERRSFPNQQVDASKSPIRHQVLKVKDRSERPNAGPTPRSFSESLTSVPAQDAPAKIAPLSPLLPVREKTRSKGGSESSRGQGVESPVQLNTQQTTQSLPSSRGRERVKASPEAGDEGKYLDPLSPDGERVLNHPHPSPLPSAGEGISRGSFSPYPDRSSDRTEKVSHTRQEPSPATPGQSRPTPVIANTVQSENSAKSRAEPAQPHPVSPRVQPVMPPEERPREPSRRETPPTIQVTIGRIEVRAVTPPSRPKTTRQPVRPREPGLSLDDYLNRRGKSR